MGKHALLIRRTGPGSPIEQAVMALLDAGGSLSASEGATRFGCAKASLYRVLRALMEEGKVVCRVRDGVLLYSKREGEKPPVWLTPQGKKLRMHSLERAVREFFTRNPEEELTQLDIAEKFGFAEKTVSRRIPALVRVGLLNKTMRNRIAHYHLPV